MKTNLILKRNIAVQVKFIIFKNNKKKLNSTLFSLIRLKNPLSLIYKTILINDLFGLTRVTRKKSDFLLVLTEFDLNYLNLDPQFNVIFKRLHESNLNDNTRINNITYKKGFSLSLTITDLISVVKRNKIENQYDFFNYPVKFNSTIELSVIDYIIVSTFFNGI